MIDVVIFMYFCLCLMNVSFMGSSAFAEDILHTPFIQFVTICEFCCDVVCFCLQTQCFLSNNLVANSFV